jgi:hypothetical protein
MMDRKECTELLETFSRMFLCDADAGSLFKNGYWYTSVNGRKFLVHRIIWAMVNGEHPNGHIDHANGNSADNRIENLRLATKSQNGANKKKYGGSSRYKGVCWHKKAGKWAAYIGSSKSEKLKKRKHLGLFVTEEDAHAAYMVAAKEFYGEFARAM